MSRKNRESDRERERARKRRKTDNLRISAKEKAKKSSVVNFIFNGCTYTQRQKQQEIVYLFFFLF